ncbi:Adaptive-response sensory-kinase SasA [subsurface metagenome]
MSKMRDDNPLTAKIYKLLLYFIPPLLLAALIFLCTILINHLDSIIFKTLTMISGGLLGFLAVYFFCTNSPWIKSCKLQVRELQAFCKAIKKAASSLELQEVIDTSARIIVDVTGVRGCSIRLLDAKSGKMELRAVAGIENDVAGNLLDIDENIYQKGLLKGEPIVVRDVFLRDFPEINDEIESLICVPLRLEQKIFGAICVYGERGQKLSQQMISILSSLGDVVSLTIAHAYVYEDLKGLVRTKTQFMLQASHELISPLNTIQSIARTILQGYMGELSEKQREMISRIDIRSQILSEIVSDLLTLARGRVILPTIKLKRVNMNRIVQETVKFFETKSREKSLDMELLTIGEAPVNGSEEGLRSIVTNLISNAIKYTPEGGKVTLRLFENQSAVVFEISDTGIGIPEDEQERLFSEFFRASNARTLSETGTGLGMAIVKATVEQHGGSVEVESEQGKGATFRVHLHKAEG